MVPQRQTPFKPLKQKKQNKYRYEAVRMVEEYASRINTIDSIAALHSSHAIVHFEVQKHRTEISSVLRDCRAEHIFGLIGHGGHASPDSFRKQ